MHPFDEAIAIEQTSTGVFTGTVSAAYANMVGTYGGITHAILLNAAMSHAERIGEPVALTVNFAGPIAAGEFEVTAVAARTNRSTQHWNLSLVQGGEIAATGTAVFAQRRETWSAPEARPPSGVLPAAALTRSPLIGRPPWMHRYDMRFARGGLPDAFDGVEQSDSLSISWIRDEPPRPLDFQALAAMSDSFFLRIYVRRHMLQPAATISLTTYFHADTTLLAAQADRHALAVARASNFRNGYFEQNAELWSDAGQLLASSHQMVYYRE